MFQRGLGALPSTSKFVAVDSHKHCLRQYASLKNVVFDNYAQTAFYRYNYANKGLNFILVSDKMILTNGVCLLKEVAERLRSLRESVKLSQVKMAEIVGVKQSGLNRYELNQASPTFETLTRYADYFDISMDYIFGLYLRTHGQSSGQAV